MVSVLASNGVDRGFEPRLGQTKDYNIDICYFSARYAGSTLHNNISWREHVNLQSDDDEVCFVFYQHPKLDMYGASSLTMLVW
jgi:hypothetical protein